MNKYLEIIDEAIRSADKDRAEMTARVSDHMRLFRSKASDIAADNISTILSNVDDVRFWSNRVREDNVLIQNLMAIKKKMLDLERREES